MTTLAGQNTKICDLCNEKQLTSIYTPESSCLGMTVFACPQCGLVQSQPDPNKKSKRIPSLSGDADWGNIRYGKGFSTSSALSFIEHNNISFEQVSTILDVGSSRGDFCRTLSIKYPHKNITAIEPDSRLNQCYNDLDSVEHHNIKIENSSFSENSFDFIYCSHTLEHLDSPLSTLKQLHSYLSKNGRIYIEVPSLNHILNTDMVEEWFIDKHQYHFTKNTLTAMALRAGFSILGKISDNDHNLCAILEKNTFKNIQRPTEIDAIKQLRSMCKTYTHNLITNRQALKQTTQALHSMCEHQRGIVWGAGRILDSMVKYGGLDLNKFVAIIDKELHKLHPDAYGVPIHPPSAFNDFSPQFALITSRVFFVEISEHIKKLSPQCRIVNWSELMTKLKTNNQQ